MAKTNKFVFDGLHIVAWIIFVGLSIEAGGMIVNFFFGVFKPETIPYLYQKLDLTEMYTKSKWAFFSMYSFIVVISFMKAFLFYLVIKLLSKLDLSKPFNTVVSKQITQISYCTFSIGIISHIAKQCTNYLIHRNYEVHQLNESWGDSQAYILMAGIIYVIAAIFTKGVEIQNENDLTV